MFTKLGMDAELMTPHMIQGRFQGWVKKVTGGLLLQKTSS